MTTLALLVDDNHALLELMRLILERAGYQTITTIDSRQVLDLAAAHQPNIILMNDVMPFFTGSDLCAQLKRTPELAHIPILMVSASDRLMDRDYLAEIGANAVLPKPYQAQDLLNAIQRLLG
jgi:CheY-like chemotaxis protein